MNKMTKLSVLTGAALTAGAFLASPASATQAVTPCYSGNVCLYRDPGLNGNGGIAQFDTIRFNYDGEIFDNGLAVNDAVSSIWNRTGDRINFYLHAGANIRDLCIVVPANGSVSNLAGTGCDDALSSHYSAQL